MFNLSNFDVDIDDDFSSNIFSNAVNSGSKNASEKKEILEDLDIFSNKTTSKDLLQKKQLREQTNLGNIINKNNVSNIQSMKDLRENIFKRPCVQYEQPQKKRHSCEGLLQRKFPGPAGLLPDKPFKEMSDVSLPKDKPRDEKDEQDIEKPTVFSQCSGSVFEESSYQKLLSDFNLNESKNPLNKYTVEWLKKTAVSKGLQGRKIPFLGLVVHSVSHTMPDPVVVLRDPTGEVHGSLHREVWADMGSKLKAGIVLALRQVGVLITGVIRRQIYLNITMNNILALYSPTENGGQVEITTINKISKSELEKSFEQWLPQTLKDLPPKSYLNSPLFATVNELDPLSKRNDNISNLKNKLETFVERPKENREAVGGRKPEEVLANLGIDLTDCDFNEEMGVMEGKTSPPRTRVEEGGVASRRGNSGEVLSQAESLIFQEVLSGINLDEFET